MNKKPTLFLGSASETESSALKLGEKLERRVDLHHWANVFELGEYNLQALQREAAECDFAVFVWGTEDKAISRGKRTPAPRDNVVYEAGLFAGALGEHRVFVLHAKGTKIPSDYLGVTTETFIPKRLNATKLADRICARVEQLGSKPARLLSGYWWQIALTRDERSVASFVRVRPQLDGRSVELGGHSWNLNGELIARWDSTATQFDEHSSTLHYCWEGKAHRDEGVPLYFGVGQIRYGISPFVGQFSSTRRHEGRKIERTRHKSAVYLPTSKQDIRVMTGYNLSGRKKTLERVLNIVKEYE